MTAKFSKSGSEWMMTDRGAGREKFGDGRLFIGVRAETATTHRLLSRRCSSSVNSKKLT